MADPLKVEVRGASNLARTSAAAARGLADLAQTNRAAADRVRSSARPPRRTGRLAGSITVLHVSATEASVGSGVVYAPVIEFGWPAHGIEGRYFLTAAAAAAWYSIQNLYADHVDDQLASVKGT